MTVDPLSHADRREGDCLQDGTAGDPFEVVGFRSAGEGDADATRDGVGAHLTGAGTVSAVDGEKHWGRLN